MHSIVNKILLLILLINKLVLQLHDWKRRIEKDEAAAGATNQPDICPASQPINQSAKQPNI